MKVGDLVRPSGSLWQDVGLIVDGGPARFVVMWGDCKKQYFKRERLEVISESR